MYIRTSIVICALGLAVIVHLCSNAPPSAVAAEESVGVAAASSNDAATHLPKTLMSELPFDVDIDTLRKLSTTPAQAAPPFDIRPEYVPQAKRLFDVFAWRMFIAL